MCSLLGKTEPGTLVVSIVTIVGLIIAKELNSLLSRKLPIPIPVELIAVSDFAYAYFTPPILSVIRYKVYIELLTERVK